MLCLSGFELYSRWVSLYFETCANGHILSLGHLWLKQLSGGLGRWKDSSAFSPPQTAIWLALLADLFSHFSPNAECSPDRLSAG